MPGKLEADNLGLHRWIWQVVTGYSLELVTTPHQASLPKLLRFAANLSNMLAENIHELEQMSAIQESQPASQSVHQSYILGSQEEWVTVTSREPKTSQPANGQV